MFVQYRCKWGRRFCMYWQNGSKWSPMFYKIFYLISRQITYICMETKRRQTKIWPGIHETSMSYRWKRNKQDTCEDIEGSVWLSLFMESYGNAYYCPRRLAPVWAQLDIYTSKQYKFDPSQTMVCIWWWTRNHQCGIFRWTPFHDQWRMVPR
jgi:hypothetical protein